MTSPIHVTAPLIEPISIRAPAANENNDTRSKGAQDFAKLIHTRYLSDREKILLEALKEYKSRGYKRALLKIGAMILVCLFLLTFTTISIGCWSEYLELVENLRIYDQRYSKLRVKNSSNVGMDCPMIGFLESVWKPRSSHVDLFGKIISIISIRKLIQLGIRLYHSIKLKTISEDDARKNADETQKEIKDLAEPVFETLFEV